MLNNPVTSVIIPALNEAESIEHVVNNVLQYPCITEVIIVDNGSTDGTYEIAKKIAQKEGERVRVLQENIRGKANAIKKGIADANGELIIFQDADLEYSPCQIPKIVQLLEKYEVVHGCRNGRLYKIGIFPFMANKLLLYLVNLQFRNTNLSDIFTGQRGYRKYVLEQMNINTTGFELETELTLKALEQKVSLIEIDIPYSPRSKKEGKKIGLSDFYKILLFFFKSQFKKTTLIRSPNSIKRIP